MKSSIVTYPDQQFAIGPGKCLSGREKYEDCAERLFTVYSCTGDYRRRPASEGLRVHRGTVLPRSRQLNHFSRGRTITLIYQNGSVDLPLIGDAERAPVMI